MRNFLFSILIFSFSSSVMAADCSLLETIFIKESVKPGLALSEKKHKELADFICQVGEKKRKAKALLDRSLTELAKGQASGNVDSKVASYKQALQVYSAVHVEELQGLEKILHPEELAKYLELKLKLEKGMKKTLTPKSVRSVKKQ